MMNWSDGYHTEALYTYGYYKELSPTLQRLAVLLAGYEGLPASDGDVHMELGFGQGVSINIHAASQKGHYIGDDFNPSHVVHAQQLAQAAQLDADLSDASFAEMAARTDLPMCNSISLHGIWSWINDANRAHITSIIKRCLKPGGIVYNSYNSVSGHAGFLPWRDMMWQHYELQTGSALERIDLTIKHFSDMFEKNPSLLEQNPALKTTWQRIQTSDRHYLLHEYFNANWDCFSLSQVAEDMAAAKMQFVGTTNNNQYINHLAMDEGRLAQVQAQTSPLAAEMWRDALLGNTFRQDLFVKGGRKLGNAEILRRLRQVKFVAVVDGETFANFLFSTQDSRRFHDDLFDAVKNTIFADHASPKTFAELQVAVDTKYDWTHILQVLVLKINAGQLQPCLDTVEAVAQQRCHDLNQLLLQQLDDKIAGVYVASPVTGMGISLDFVQAWGVRGVLQDAKTTDLAIAEQIWQCLQNNQRVLIDGEGNGLSGHDSHIALLLTQLASMRLRLPNWEALGLLPNSNKA